MKPFSRGMIVLLACVLTGGCGGQEIPSYSLQDSADKITVMLHTHMGNFPVDIQKPLRDQGRGSGNRTGTATRNGQTVHYEVKFQNEGKKITLTSVTVDGQEVPKSG
jgi:hypothetical protein